MSWYIFCYETSLMTQNGWGQDFDIETHGQ